MHAAYLQQVHPVTKLVFVDSCLCIADPAAETIMDYASAVPAVTYAMNNAAADVFCQKVTMTIWQSDIIIRTPLGLMEIETTLIGRNNVYNVLAAVAAGLALNVPLQVRPQWRSFSGYLDKCATLYLMPYSSFGCLHCLLGSFVEMRH